MDLEESFVEEAVQGSLCATRKQRYLLVCPMRLPCVHVFQSMPVTNASRELSFFNVGLVTTRSHSTVHQEGLSHPL